jgi:predicted ATPase
MRIKIRNFGPIAKVIVDIGPLTAVVGKNNLGKSYLAQLYYTLLDTASQLVPSLPPHFQTQSADRSDLSLYYYRYYRRLMLSPDEITGITRQIKSSMTDSEIVRIVIDRLLSNKTREIQQALQLSLERSFGVKIWKLVSVNSNRAQIRCDLFEHLSLTVQIIKKRGTLKVSLLPLRSGKKLVKDIEKSSSKLLHDIRRARTKKGSYVSRLYMILMEELTVLKRSQGRAPTWSVGAGRAQTSAIYIPAGRGGLLESYETVVGGLVSLSPLAPVRGLSMPPLPGMAAQFYSVLLRLQGHKGPMSRVVSTEFRELLQGDVQLKKMKGQVKSRLIYQFSSNGGTASTDVIHAASMIKELSPIYLIVQELIRPGDFLLIEEPESHLHPGAQLRFVNIIATLVKNGVNIFLTTHSDLFIRAVGHLVGRAKVQEADKSLDSRKVVFYWLKEGKLGCVSERLNVSKYGLIEEIPTFDEIVKELYEEEVNLEKKAQGRE